MQATPAKFMKKFLINKNTGCWEWQRFKDKGGYGQTKHNKKTCFAHRLSYEMHYGPIPKGCVVLHSCDNRGCVNPEHLQIGTHAENMRDMVNKGRQGHQILNSKDVALIKAFLKRRSPGKGGRTEHGACCFLGRWFGVTRAAICSIKNGTAWVHV